MNAGPGTPPAPPAQPMAPIDWPLGPPTDVAAQPAGAPGAATPGPARSFSRRFFGVIARAQTWRNLVYLLLSFPLGLFYFVFLVTALSTGLGLVIVWVGLPILLGTVAVWWVMAALERHLADGLLGTHLAPSPRPWLAEQRTWPRVKAHLGATATWKDLAFLFAKFPLGTLSFTALTTLLSVPVAFLLAPIGYRLYDGPGANVPVDERYLDVGFTQIDTVWKAALLVPIGLVLLFCDLHLLNGLAFVWKRVAVGLLGPEPSSPTATPPGDTPS